MSRPVRLRPTNASLIAPLLASDHRSFHGSNSPLYDTGYFIFLRVTYLDQGVFRVNVPTRTTGIYRPSLPRRGRRPVPPRVAHSGESGGERTTRGSRPRLQPLGRLGARPSTPTTSTASCSLRSTAATHWARTTSRRSGSSAEKRRVTRVGIPPIELRPTRAG